MCDFGLKLASIVPECMNDEEDSWDFEGTVTARKFDLFGLCDKLRDVQSVCVDGSKPVPTANVNVVELACEGVEAKRKNATLLK